MRTRTHVWRPILLVLALWLAASTALAQSGGGYNLEWNTVDSGGTVTGGSYTLSGAIGQPDAGAMSGGGYTLGGGFWGRSVTMLLIYLPVIMK